MTDLVTIRTNGGARFTVAKSHAPQFEGLLNDLEANGYPIKGEQSGGYNYRTIAGTNKLSEHAFGNAVDVNWTDNPRGGKSNIPAELARSLAAKHGMGGGGDWKNPDAMHFQAGGGAVQPDPASGGTNLAQSQTPASGPQEGQAMNPLMLLLQSLGSSGGGSGPLAALTGQGGGAGVPGQGGSKGPSNMQLAQGAMGGEIEQPQLLGRRMAQAPDMGRLQQVIRGRLGLTGV